MLHCNKSTALYSLGKWREAVFSAYQSLRWDPEYVKVFRCLSWQFLHALFFKAIVNICFLLCFDFEV